MIFSIAVKETTFCNGNLIYVIRNVFYFLFVLKLEKLLENALSFETEVVLKNLPSAQPISLSWADPRCRKCNAYFI